MNSRRTHRNRCSANKKPPRQGELTLKDVCFSCQYFKVALTKISMKSPTLGTCVRYGPRYPVYDGLVQKACGDHASKHGVYPEQVWVIRILPQGGENNVKK
jgi:hypothetical protein